MFSKKIPQQGSYHKYKGKDEELRGLYFVVVSSSKVTKKEIILYTDWEACDNNRLFTWCGTIPDFYKDFDSLEKEDIV